MTTAGEIIARVAAEHGLSVSDILGKRKRRVEARARRRAVVALVEAFPALGLVWVGRQVGGMRASSVGYLIGRYYLNKGHLFQDERWPEKVKGKRAPIKTVNDRFVEELAREERRA